MTGLYGRTFAMVFHMKEHTLYAYGEGLAAAGTRKIRNIARINFRHDTTVNTFPADNQLGGTVQDRCSDTHLC